MHTKGFTLLELIVVLAIIGSITLLVGPSFTFSEDTAVKQFTPFQKFIEQQRNNVIHSGKPAVLELYASGKLLVRAVEKNTEDQYPKLGQLETEAFTVESAVKTKEKAHILFFPDGTTEPFVIKLPRQEKKLFYNGTVARGRIL